MQLPHEGNLFGVRNIVNNMPFQRGESVHDALDTHCYRTEGVSNLAF